MTLIIGMKCSDGVIVVGDRKVTDPSANEVTFEKKLMFPLPNSPVIVAAAGFTHLFKEFNRRLPEMVEQRQMDFYMLNINKLAELGENIEDYIQPTKEPETIQSNDSEIEQLPKKQESLQQNKKLPRLPYYYSIETFLIDCKLLIKQICGTSDLPDPLDVLVAVYSNNGARLHHIDSEGNEEEVGFCAIGSGTPFINLFKKNWSSDLSIAEASKEFCFAIKIIDKLKFDKFVGVEENLLPDMNVIIDDGRFGIFDLQDEETDDLKKKIKQRVNIMQDATNPI